MNTRIIQERVYGTGCASLDANSRLGFDTLKVSQSQFQPERSDRDGAAHPLGNSLPSFTPTATVNP